MYDFSPRVQAIAGAEGIGLAELTHMVQHSAITSKGGFNRRYHNWLFHLGGNNDLVIDMKTLHMRGPADDQDVQGHRTCDLCTGHGCKGCGWWGAVLI